MTTNTALAGFIGVKLQLFHSNSTVKDINCFLHKLNLHNRWPSFLIISI
jgi:hypothetical protein